ncbi:MAG: glucokinase [Gemmatimonadetes bacterium]|uniref:Glucokinase n=1 Tax=Candidatus Kutchimonas denitrificans TaxID=3056748 RepID=A0AAE4Z8W3_9BACT|nr:glucokinase [Gemmatimonadota bacterium]NIR75818.1 glucokinase [Candidatus Kutchimonas denitrificans]NIS01986.1 glucokinase [Gemmatimonadota bacterium]NIT67790.1 glucokinase [Gemmatimonadota bacterium]NIU53777.1 glucokinase [Gemmatimonadota bacterium]
MRVLSGDIGGTNARLAVYDVGDGAFDRVDSETYPSSEYDSLADIVRTFVQGRNLDVTAACFGVPGPVSEGRAEITNLPWVVETDSLAAAADVARAFLLNDLEAQAYGIACLDEDDLVVLHEGEPSAGGNAALIAAGTGLGQAGLYWDGHELRPFACEGGHASFAPTGELQIELLEFLSSRFGGHVSWERVVSGPGLVNLHDFLIEYRRPESTPEEVEQLRKARPALITEAAAENACTLCQEAVELFVRFYGAEAGNLALKLMATGGVYIGGGIAPKIVDRLSQPMFLEAFLSKGRMRPLLQEIPIRVIVRPQTALLGAARYAARQAERAASG